jgi:hypothetical protein
VKHTDGWMDGTSPLQVHFKHLMQRIYKKQTAFNSILTFKNVQLANFHVKAFEKLILANNVKNCHYNGNK